MESIKVSSKVDRAAWEALKRLADEQHQSISGLLTEAVRDYVRKQRVRPDVLRHLDESIRKNEELGWRLAE
jgi:predicted transcriptional regulator